MIRWDRRPPLPAWLCQGDHGAVSHLQREPSQCSLRRSGSTWRRTSSRCTVSAAPADKSSVEGSAGPRCCRFRRYGAMLGWPGGRLGGISKRGDAYLRRLLIHGARTALRWRRARAVDGSTWVRGLLERRPPNIAAVAIANKTARIAWAVLARDGRTVRRQRLKLPDRSEPKLARPARLRRRDGERGQPGPAKSEGEQGVRAR